MRKIISYFLFTMFLGIGIYALVGGSPAEKSGILRGYVYSMNGNPLQGAMITATSLDGKIVRRTLTDGSGFFVFLNLPLTGYQVRAEKPGYVTSVQSHVLTGEKDSLSLTFKLKAGTDLAEKPGQTEKGVLGGVVGGVLGGVVGRVDSPVAYPPPPPAYLRSFNTEEYDRIYDNTFLDALGNPLSTFSIDVDTASYSIVRRFINEGRFPPKDAVRIEEMINYFSYDYPLPEGNYPFSISVEISTCPWNIDHRLVHIGLQGKKLEAKTAPPSNLVFLLDVSGSMRPENKLPLLKQAFRLLVEELSDKDRVAIVVYAGAAGVALPSTAAHRKEEIISAIDKLQAGGSTAGGEGIQLAYKIAEENFIREGNNRVILATDGDFNVGISSTSELVRLIEEKRKKGIFLTVLGFGMGNYKDGRMEQLADKGNGNYFYVDNLLEAKKVFVDDMRGTLFTIAKDVKIQVEFNPAKVKAYRLIGYENRMLKKEDFADDTKDAGELGAGHTVTALYEIIPYGSKESIPGVDLLKYQETKIRPEAFKSKDMLTVKLRYKKPDGEKSQLIELAAEDKGTAWAEASEDFKFSAAVAGFGMLLRDSEFKGHSSFADILELARAGRGSDRYGYRAEFIRLVEMCSLLDRMTDKHD
ncbi:MAG: von Willebrand factor type A domain-containing protein [Clostridiales bacterium]|nr:von Willebrand factor type A domain-containing protein [Clostridiales bacterium]